MPGTSARPGQQHSGGNGRGKKRKNIGFYQGATTSVVRSRAKKLKLMGFYRGPTTNVLAVPLPPGLGSARRFCMSIFRTMKRPHLTHALTLSLCAMAALPLAARAQTVRPDAGSTQRDLEQRPLEVPRAGPELPSAPARPAINADAQARFTVAAVTVTGNTAFDAATLADLVKNDLLGKRVSLADLQAAAAKITAYYRVHGFLVARAYVPAQKIDEENAKVEIAVIEGALGSLNVNNQSRLSEAAVARFTAPLRPGTLLTQHTFARQILLLSDQPGVPPGDGVGAVLRPGRQTGQSDMEVDVGRMPLVTGQAEVDNYGNRLTGATRATGQMNLLSPFGLGDSFTFRYIDSFQGLRSGTLSASAPLGGNGLRIGATYADTRYRLGKDFASLQASGTAQSTGAFVSYPWVRTQQWNLNTSLGFDHRKFVDRVDATSTVTPKHVDVANLTFSGDLRDMLAANSVLVWSAAFESGRVGIDEPGASAADHAAAQTQGSFGKLYASLLYQQLLARNWIFYGSLIAQRATKNLDSSEKLALGGAYAVRAYPVGEAAGDEGEIATVELRYALPQVYGVSPGLVLFADQGISRINRTQFAPGANRRTLGAAGLGFTLAKAQDFSARVYWAAKTTSAPATSDTDRANRVWAQVVKYF